MEQFAVNSHGVDVSASMVNRARAKCKRTNFIIGDLTRGEISVPQVNLITAFRFFGNAEDELRRSALRALYAALQPGGHFVFDNHRNPWSIHNTLLACRGERPNIDLHYFKTRRLLKEVGFSILRTYGVASWLILNRLNQPAVFRSRFVSLVEPLSHASWIAPFSPDFVVVARKA
jgi:SAM-dependent methyltransferase